MKCFQAFRLDTANQCLWRGQERVPMPPKPYDMLRYLVENPGRLITQDELLEKLWPEIYVNPELIRKYILDIRKILGDRPDKPEFIETVTKRGYRFIASVVDVDATNPTKPTAIEERVATETIRSRLEGAFRKPSLWKLAFIPVLAVAVAAAISRESRVARNGPTVASSNDPSIAVLPFADMSPGKDQEYFSDGLAEQLIHELAKKSSLKVVGRSSAFQFKGKSEDLRAVGRKLGVANVLEGSVRRDGNHLRITAELIKADDGFQLWSQTYDREIKDIFAVQDEIARSTAEALQPKLLGSKGQAVPSPVRSANPEAYQAYLQANYFTVRGQNKENLGKALDYSDAAIKLDDKYAPAWALRASVLNEMAEVGLANVREGFREARGDAERAITLDPSSASAYMALATAQIDCDWNWDAADTSITKAADLEPGNAEVFRIRSYLSRVLGNLDQAIKFQERAVALDPLRSDFHKTLGYLLYVRGRFDEAQAEMQRALDLNSNTALVHLTLGKILIAEGKPQEALAEIEKESLEWANLTGKAVAYHALRREQDSDSALAGLIAKYGVDGSYQISQVYAYRKQSEESFQWLEKAYAVRDAGLPDVKTDPFFKYLRDDPRYTALLKRMRLPA